MQITILRHGKPEFELVGNVRAKDLSKIALSYNRSGIVGNPPKEIVDIASDHYFIVCSDLPRSLRSAKALGIAKIDSIDAMFRETGIPYFNNGSITLPLSVWIPILRGLWLMGFSKNGESFVAARRRAKSAAQRLVQLADEFEKVLLVGHGFINYFIAKELLSMNWVGPARPARGFWGYSVYTFNVI